MFDKYTTAIWVRHAWLARSPLTGWRQIAIMDDFGNLVAMDWTGFVIFIEQDH